MTAIKKVADATTGAETPKRPTANVVAADKLTFVQAAPSNEAERPRPFSFTNFADGFDEHIDRSIRGYSLLRDDIVSISR